MSSLFTRIARVLLPAALVAAPAVAGPAATAHAAGDRVELVGQSFVLDPVGQLDVQLRLGEGVSTSFGPGDQVVITSHPLVPDRATFLRIRDDGPRSTTDEVVVSLDPAAADPRAGVEAGVLRVGVATEATDGVESSLAFLGSGVHPVTIDVRIDGVTTEVPTFVFRVGTEPDDEGDLSVALLMGQTSDVQVATDGTTGVTDDQRAELAALADSLEAIDTAAAAVGAEPPARAVHVEPATLQAATDTDPDLAARLVPLLTESDLVASPRLPLDPGAAAAAADAGHDTVARYTTLLSQGEDALGTVVPGARIDRSIWLPDGHLSADGAALRRQLGTRLLVLPYDLYDGLEGSTHDLVDTTQLLTVALPDGTELPATVGDPHLEPLLDGAADRPFATAVDIVADLLVVRREILDDGLVEGHGILLSRSDHAALDPAFTRDLVGLLLTSPGLRIIQPADLVTSVTPWVLDGLPVTLRLPETSDIDLAPRLALIDELSDDVVSYGSMLPDDDPRFGIWSTAIDALASTAVSDRQADAMARELRAGFDGFHDAIEVDASSFTLTGRNSDVRFALRNLTDGALTVRVSLSSPKIRFPQGDQTITLQPGISTPVTFAAEALSNGTSSVFLRVYVPAENRDVQIVDEQVLTARVNSFAGLGQLVTGAGLLLVLTWWVRHWRQSRRTALAARNVERHPSAAGAVRTSSAEQLAPDAASSLPPS